ncbi:hypothetical protein HRbin24_01157 [bacterium HR24]|nr:hypothetical protein HRbin24_01157 [bacterium HR24]
MLYLLLRHSPWLSALALGLVLLAAGIYTLVRAVDVRAQIRDELRDEQIVTSQDARIPGVLVQDAATAKAQADAIKEHTLGRWGPFSELPRDDPRRAQFIDGVALRTALNLAVMGFGITDLLLGLGAILIVAGAATVALAAPALYFLAGMVVRRPG